MQPIRLLEYTVAMFAGAALTLTGIAYFGDSHDHDDQPMSCTEHQVMVWDQYPDSAHCAANTNHAEHEG